MGVKNLLKSGVEEVKDFFQWIFEKLQDQEVRKEMLQTLGLPADNASIPPPNTDASLQNIDSYLSKATEDIDIEAFASVVVDIMNVLDALESFRVMVTTEGEGTGDEFFNFILQLYLMDYNRLRAKKDEEHKKGYNPIFLYHGLYTIWKVGDFYTELSSAHPEEFSLVKIGKFIGASFYALLTSNVKWSKFTDGQDMNDQEWQEHYDALSAEERFVLQEKQMRYGTNLLGLTLIVLSYFDIFPFKNNLTYGFEARELTTSATADTISQRTITMAFTFDQKDVNETETAATIYITAVVRPPWQSKGLGLEFMIAGDLKLEQEYDNGVKLFAESNALPTENANMEIRVEHGTELDRWIFGDTEGTRLEIGRFTASIAGSVSEEDLDFNIGIKNCAFVLHKGRSDSFIGSLLPEKGISGVFDLGIGYSVKRGFYLDGGSGLSVLIPLHAALTDSKKNNLILNSIFINGKAAKKENEPASLELSIGFTASLFGFTAVVERTGLLITDTKVDPVKFKPPTGIGIAVDIGLLKGGGYLYLDADKGEYAGAVELKFGKRLSLKGVGIINTKIPGIDYSVLLIITMEFDPALEIGFGFSLKGIGGIYGLHRTINVDALKEGVKTNAIRSILFPQDIVANITRIISDIKQIFPPLKGRTVLGLMAELQYARTNFLSFQLGIIWERDTNKFLILGVVTLKIPKTEKHLLKLQINFVGVIDKENETAAFDASLYDSYILTFPLTGDAAFRLSLKSPKYYILSIGGFHPAFTEVPDDLKNMRRLTLSLLSGENPRFTIQAYLTSTSNTFQHGAKAELYASKGSFNIYGYVSYDLLFRLTETTITLLAHFSAGVALRRNTSVIMGIHVSGEFTGFEPCHIQGKASVSFFFFSISVPFSHTWGSERAAFAADSLADLFNMLRMEIDDSRNWQADLPVNNNLHVTIRKIKLPDNASDNLIVHPFGILTFSQFLMPLNFEMNRFGYQVPKDVNSFTVKPAEGSFEETKEQFAPSNFIELTDEEKLARPSYESMISGFRISAASALETPIPVPKDVTYELSYLGNRRKRFRRGNLYPFNTALFATATKASAVSVSPLSHSNNRVSLNAPELVVVKEPAFAIANTSDLKLHSEELVTNSYAEALQQYNTLVKKTPRLREEIQIISHYELNKN